MPVFMNEIPTSRLDSEMIQEGEGHFLMMELQIFVLTFFLLLHVSKIFLS